MVQCHGYYLNFIAVFIVWLWCHSWGAFIGAKVLLSCTKFSHMLQVNDVPLKKSNTVEAERLMLSCCLLAANCCDRLGNATIL